MAKLLILDLGANKLTAIVEGIFGGLTNLQTLYLNGNQLTSMHERTLLTLNQLKQIDLSDNKFYCTCYFINTLNMLTNVNVKADCIFNDVIINPVDINCTILYKHLQMQKLVEYENLNFTQDSRIFAQVTLGKHFLFLCSYCFGTYNTLHFT